MFYKKTETAIDRMDLIEQFLCEKDELFNISMPIIEMLLPLKTEYDLSGVSKEGRTVTLSKTGFPDGYENGINRSCGFDIIWE